MKSLGRDVRTKDSQRQAVGDMPDFKGRRDKGRNIRR